MKRKARYILGLFLVGLLAMAALYYVSRSRTFQFFGTIVSRVEVDNRVVALTFDDGPAANTDSILHILRRYNVPATFFLTGSEVAADMDATRRIVREGHTVGDHTFSHQRMLFKTQRFISSEITTTDSLLRACGYQKTIYFRPPYCKKLFGLPWYLSRTGRVTVTWDVEPDSKHSDPTSILSDVQASVRPGSIILLHAMYPNRSASLAALPGIIEWLQASGYTLVPLDQLLYLDKHKN